VIVPRRFKSRARRGIRLARDANLSVTPALYEPVVLINTSGTTGLPKFVIHTPETLSELACLRGYQRIGQGSFFAALAPCLRLY